MNALFIEYVPLYSPDHSLYQAVALELLEDHTFENVNDDLEKGELDLIP